MLRCLFFLPPPAPASLESACNEHNDDGRKECCVELQEARVYPRFVWAPNENEANCNGQQHDADQDVVIQLASLG